MFRKEVKSRVMEILNESRLTEHAFRVIFGDPDLVTVKYILREDFSFAASYSKEGFIVIRLPGEELLIEEMTRVNTVDEILNKLAEWIRFVQTEDEVGPEIDTEVSKLKEVFFRDLARHVSDENVHFTKTEAEELSAKVEKLEQQIEQLMAAQKAADSEVRKVKKLFRDAKTDVETMTKKKWLVVGGGKIFNALISIGRSREGRKALVDSVKGLLN